ncbi:PucR family transcriptional regulator [Arthrobacter sp. CAU 1506]|uniref:PucR family transcriptional regulator n=1 Tax=Arthrobacter sp. CAU 1506 TaxID=2560052 RepID=UPI0010AD929C|nr:PucR family transcriptional regulator [Arthrobacter sp. CAU 1506]TJY66166.1 PucR family transcriptional regulator [Arthrobacter sp. CAU 1506]
MVSLAQLSNELGDALRPAVPGSVPGIQLSGVHVSELADPGAYLEGGELLLTTGIPLGGAAEAVEDYVQRLAAKGVAALGLGLGEGLDSVPPELVRACSAQGVELLVVPDGVPFLDVSRTFWELASRSDQAGVIANLGTQTALARATMRADALPSVVQGLAQALGGWVAYLPADDGEEATVWPASALSLLPHLKLETTRLNVAGAHSAATFWLHGTPVVEYPILVGGRIDGFLAIGSGRTLTKADRQIIMTVCVLLALKAQQRDELLGTTAVLGSVVAKLIARGQVEAARLVANDGNLGPLPERVRVLAARIPTADAVPTLPGAVSRLQLADGGSLPAAAVASCILRYDEDAVAYFLLDAGLTEPVPAGLPGEGNAEGELLAWAGTAVPAGAAWAPSGPGAGPGAVDVETAAAWTEPLGLEEIKGAMAAVHRAAVAAPVGRLVDMAADDEARADRWVEALAEYSRAELLETVAAYLRHQGRWEDTARQLKVHRNSLRHRMAVAERLLGVTLDDPDVVAHLWLALRRRGL